MIDGKINLLIIIGSVGVGKSTVADALSEMLRKQDISHAVIDMDYLRYVYPRPKSDPFHAELGIKNLSALWNNYQEVGVRTVLLPNVIGQKADVDAITQAIPEARVTVVMLRASLETIYERLRERHGQRDKDNLDWHLDRATTLTKQLEDSGIEDIIIDTDNKPLEKVCNEILTKWPSVPENILRIS